ncbi:hypothetical protein PIROE2DRAFT_13992 [Piromyces sp. E2]|nr:hypothetical protein PIROE2DRAFT_13992 [Piromyces sp. E2]|eukprot:OUM60276.1 hypothetical protein PIROE2DRAFT_13992 [Piromyces sp. E2]
MRLFCCLPFKKKKINKNRKKSTSKHDFTTTTAITTTTEPIKNNNNNNNNRNVIITDKEIIPLKGDVDVNTTENIIPVQDGNISIDTSIAAVTALSYVPNTEDHSYYVIDYTNVSSLERDRLQDKYDSLQLYSPTASTAPSLHSNRKSLTEFQSAVSLESTESFFTTASYIDGDDTDSHPHDPSTPKPLSKRTSGISNLSNTNYTTTTNDNAIRVLGNKRLSTLSNSNYFKARKSLSFHSFTNGKNSIGGKGSKDDINTDTNATVNNILYKINKDHEISTHSTDITVNNVIVLPTSSNANNTTNDDKMVMPTSIPKEVHVEKEDSISVTSDVTPFLSKQPSTTKPPSPISKMPSIGRATSNTRVFTGKDLDDVAERALHPDLTKYTLDSVIKNRIKVYTRVRPSSGINEYIIVGHLDKVTLREAYDVYMDLEYRKEWDDLKQQINLFERKNSNKRSSSSSLKNDLKDFEIHWEIKLPWPFSNREYIFERNTYEHKYNDMMFLIADNSSLNSNSAQENNIKNVNSKAIRITEYEQMTVFYSDREDGKCNVYMEMDNNEMDNDE